MAKKDSSFPVLDLIVGIVAVPYSFFVGFILGLAAPLAAIAAMVFGVRFLTGKMPFLRLTDEQEPERRLLLELVEQEQVQTLFDAEKQKIMSGLGSFPEEMKALFEDTKATAAEAEEL